MTSSLQADLGGNPFKQCAGLFADSRVGAFHETERHARRDSAWEQ
ncbi:MAG: hypothetical protein V2I65_06405 [Paracoccaceae bacterium]|nr:hypothetical protein [Paracoccaceae bacterium]